VLTRSCPSLPTQIVCVCLRFVHYGSQYPRTPHPFTKPRGILRTHAGATVTAEITLSVDGAVVKPTETVTFVVDDGEVLEGIEQGKCVEGAALAPHDEGDEGHARTTPSTPSVAVCF